MWDFAQLLRQLRFRLQKLGQGARAEQTGDLVELEKCGPAYGPVHKAAGVRLRIAAAAVLLHRARQSGTRVHADKSLIHNGAVRRVILVPGTSIYSD